MNWFCKFWGCKKWINKELTTHELTSQSVSINDSSFIEGFCYVPRSFLVLVVYVDTCNLKVSFENIRPGRSGPLVALRLQVTLSALPESIGNWEVNIIMMCWENEYLRPAHSQRSRCLAEASFVSAEKLIFLDLFERAHLKAN